MSDRGVARKGFDLDLRDGGMVEDEILQALVGFYTVEVKRMDRALEFGGVFVELRWRGRPSGLSTTEAEWWVYVVDHRRRMLWIRTRNLRELVATRPLTKGGDNKECDGVYLRIVDLATAGLEEPAPGSLP